MSCNTTLHFKIFIHIFQPWTLHSLITKTMSVQLKAYPQQQAQCLPHNRYSVNSSSWISRLTWVTGRGEERRQAQRSYGCRFACHQSRNLLLKTPGFSHWLHLPHFCSDCTWVRWCTYGSRQPPVPHLHEPCLSIRLSEDLYIAGCQGVPHVHGHSPASAAWMLPGVGIHHLDYSQASHFQKPVGLMDGMASPRGSACLWCSFASLARTGFHFKHVSRMETFRGESKFAEEERL